MPTLHTFGCSITQGFALPDVVRPMVNDRGQPLSDSEIQQLGSRFNWEDIHIYAPSDHAWPAELGRILDIAVINHARRGACFNQIARQAVIAAPSIRARDTVIVMWTYLSRISLQWPGRTAVPFCNIVDPRKSWRTRILPGFNTFFGLSGSTAQTMARDDAIYKFIHDSAMTTYLHPLAVYDQYYRSLVLQTAIDGMLRATGARVIHLSVEPEPYLDQLERARSELDPTVREPWVIPDPQSWYGITVDHHSCRVIHDPSIPPAENDQHPSVEHHRRFAADIHRQYF
jgi:hypothetical protein